MTILEFEHQRIAEQLRLDGERSQEQRNILGQFATPNELALDITRAAFEMVPHAKSCIEPACGTGSFISAALSCKGDLAITAVEKDVEYCEVASTLWSSETVHILNEDFFDFAREAPEGSFDLLLSNPPYSRHHHLDQGQKEKYREITKSLTRKKLSQLAGLHAYFILSGTALLAENGVGAWLIPSETFSVNFGKPIKQYLTSEVSIERIHFFDESDLQFGDALVSSCVLFVRRKPCENEKKVVLTRGGTVMNPADRMLISIQDLLAIPKWQHAFRKVDLEGVPLGTLLKVSRGFLPVTISFLLKAGTNGALWALAKSGFSLYCPHHDIWRAI